MNVIPYSATEQCIILKHYGWKRTGRTVYRRRTITWWTRDEVHEYPQHFAVWLALVKPPAVLDLFQGEAK
jgi:hypothetical protein